MAEQQLRCGWHCEIDYEKLVFDREAVTRKLIDFAGLEWNDACLSPEHNPKPIMTANVWQGRQPVYAVRSDAGAITNRGSASCGNC